MGREQVNRETQASSPTQFNLTNITPMCGFWLKERIQEYELAAGEKEECGNLSTTYRQAPIVINIKWL